MYRTFKDYVASNGTNYIERWFKKALTEQQRSDLEALIGVLEKQKHWGMPDYRTLTGKYSVLGELRLKAKPPIRLVGYKNGDSEFIFLIGCKHRESYDPIDALDTALSRKTDLENKRGETIDHDYDNYDKT